MCNSIDFSVVEIWLNLFPVKERFLPPLSPLPLVKAEPFTASNRHSIFISLPLLFFIHVPKLIAYSIHTF